MLTLTAERACPKPYQTIYRTAGGARTWILDPIDGTKGFIRGEHFCVALGLALKGDPALGVLACPNLPSVGHCDNGPKFGDGCLFFAVRGAGAFVMPLNPPASGVSLEEEIARATPIRVSGVASGAEARFFESVEAAHSSHSAAGQVTQGTFWSRGVCVWSLAFCFAG